MANTPRHTTTYQKDRETIIISNSYNEKELYEYYRNIAENFIETLIAIEIRADHQSSENIYSAINNIKSIFRAAVYGNFSIIFKNVFSEKDLQKCLKLTHSAFCDLEIEGREFNGYISKGISLSSPLLLLNDFIIKRSDFLCFEKKELAKITDLHLDINTNTNTCFFHELIYSKALFYVRNANIVKIKSSTDFPILSERISTTEEIFLYKL